MKNHPTCWTCRYYNLEHNIDYEHDEREYSQEIGASFCYLHGHAHIGDPDNPPPLGHDLNDEFGSCGLRCGYVSKQKGEAVQADLLTELFG